MKMFTKESLSELHDKSIISDVIDSFELDSQFCYECPFCGVFGLQIDDEDRNYHCYGCDAHGNSVDFLMNHNRMTFE